jgi:hypothetical protein
MKMKKLFKLAGIFLVAAVLTACSLPVSQTVSGGTRPTLAIIGAPEGSTLVLDGNVAGDASRFDGKKQVLVVEEGFHQIAIQQNGRTLHFEKIVVAPGETKRIEVGTAERPREAQQDF